MEELGRFALRKQIGAGSYSTVYEADEGGQRCALRVFNENAVPTDPTERAAVVAAMKGLTRLEHPCIVRVLEVGDTQGKLYAAMELMTSPTLAEKLKTGGPMEEKRVVLFVRQAAQALDKARDMGYSHGNLHPGNAFVVSDEKIKLSDFAIKDIISDRSVLKEYDELARVTEDLVTAEDLLRAKGKAGGVQKLAEDFVALSLLMMRMLGAEPEARGAGETLGEYRERVLNGSLAALAGPEKGLSPHTVEIARRLLTPGGFDSPGEVVVELASAMLMRRPFARHSALEGEQPSAGSVTTTVSKDSDLVSEWLTEAEQADELALPEQGAQEAELGGELTGSFTAFYVWHSRHGGMFFIVHDGESLSIGRDPDYADVALMDPAISRKHCVISRQGSVIRVEDPGSTNGTLVNGNRVESAEIRPGDNLRIGGTRVYMTLSTQDE
jgi:serine/threonine-protein kinase